MKSTFCDNCIRHILKAIDGQHHVINRYDILPAVNDNAQSAGNKLTADEIDTLYAKLQPLTQVDEAQKLAHIEEVQKKKEASGVTNENPQNNQMICPRCGGKLALRTAGKGVNAGRKFWGCSNYPKCRYIKNIEP